MSKVARKRSDVKQAPASYPPLPPALDAAAHALAAVLLDRAHLPEGASVWKVARALGFKPELYELPGPLLGFSIPGFKKLLVDPRQTPRERRRTVGHELAEMCLSEKLAEPYHEAFCDAVADALLEPEHLGLAGLPIDLPAEVAHAA